MTALFVAMSATAAVIRSRAVLSTGVINGSPTRPVESSRSVHVARNQSSWGDGTVSASPAITYCAPVRDSAATPGSGPARVAAGKRWCRSRRCLLNARSCLRITSRRDADQPQSHGPTAERDTRAQTPAYIHRHVCNRNKSARHRRDLGGLGSLRGKAHSRGPIERRAVAVERAP